MGYGWDDFTDDVKGGYNTVKGKVKNWMGGSMRSEGQYAGVDKNNFINPGYEGANQSLNQFADERGGGPFRGQQESLANLLMKQAQGQNSYSAEQLRQNVGRLQSQQQSMAASAGPANKAMALRNAQANSGQLGVGMAGNAALAGIQERTAAANALGGVLQGARGQDISSYLGAQQQLGSNYGAQLQGTMGYEQNRTQRALGQMGAPSNKENLFKMILGGAQGAGGVAALAGSGMDLKKNIVPLKELVKRRTRDEDLGRNDPKSFERQRPNPSVEFSTFGYKPGKGPEGKFVGPMAEKIKPHAPGAIIDTSAGKMVDYNKVPVQVLAPGLKQVADVAARNPKALEGVRLSPGLAQRAGGLVDALRGKVRDVATPPMSAAEKALLEGGNKDMTATPTPQQLRELRESGYFQTGKLRNK